MTLIGIRCGMRWTVAVAAATALLAGVVVPVRAMSAGDTDNQWRPEPVEGRRAIVVFDRPPAAGIVARLRAVGITRAALFPAANAAAVDGSLAAYRAIAGWDDVTTVYREAMFAPQAFQTKPMLRVDKVQQGAAPLEHPYTGAGVTVAVLDTGIESVHPDLDDRIVANLDFDQSVVLDDITDGAYSRHDAERPFGVDEFQHGTLVAGLVAGTGEMARGDDMRGMAPGASIVNIKIMSPATHEFPNEMFAESSVLAAYQWIIDHRHDPRFPGGIRVATNSWGRLIPEGSEPVAVTEILEGAVAAGVVVVFSAGNTGPGSNTVEYPGRIPWVIAVGANCKQEAAVSGICPGGGGEVGRFSSRGPQVDVVAPGVDVWGAAAKGGYENTVFAGLLGRLPWFPPGPGQPVPGTIDARPALLRPPAPGNGDPVAESANRAWYAFGDGTSFAAPQVAGIVALMLEANPALTQAEVERILRETARDVGASGFDTSSGYGQVDGWAAVAAAAGRGPVPPPGDPVGRTTWYMHGHGPVGNVDEYLNNGEDLGAGATEFNRRIYMDEHAPGSPATRVTVIAAAPYHATSARSVSAAYWFGKIHGTISNATVTVWANAVGGASSLRVSLFADGDAFEPIARGLAAVPGGGEPVPVTVSFPDLAAAVEKELRVHVYPETGTELAVYYDSTLTPTQVSFDR